MSRHRAQLYTFVRGINRARQLCDVHAFLGRSAPAALDSSDLLRGAVMMSMSALDLLIHSTYLNEAIYRFRRGGSVTGLKLTFACLTADERNRERMLADEIYQGNAHKSFMAPDKIGEILSHLASNPWALVAAQTGQNEKYIKDRLKEVYRWRNRITHESDINPALGGIELWPIVETDVRDSLQFLDDLGAAIVRMIEAL